MNWKLFTEKEPEDTLARFGVMPATQESTRAQAPELMKRAAAQAHFKD